MRPEARNLATAAIALAALAVIGSAIVPLVPAWPFTLLEHFRFQYLWVGIAVVAACAGLRVRGWFDGALVATLVNALWVLPDLSRSSRPLPPNGTPLRVLVLNVHTSSSSYANVSELIAETNPDVVGLVEVNERWLTAITPTLAGYPQRIELPSGDNFGIALYSKLPMTGTTEELGSPVPTVVASVDVQGTSLAVLLTHPIPPIQPDLRAMHSSQLYAVGARVRTLGSLAIVMGDFNATPWSRPFLDLVAATGLCDSRAGFGLQASYPAESAIMRIPIDHVLASCAIGVTSRAIGRDVGSDHLPVIVDLAIPRS